MADGSDMMGSLRNPAAFNNVIGFRPSFGRVPSSAGELFVGQLSCAGPMGRTVADVAMLLAVMAGPDVRAPLSIEEQPAKFTEELKRDFKGTRLAWLGDLGGYLPTEPGILELCQNSFKAFESIGCVVEAARLPFPSERIWDAWLTLRHWLTASSLSELYLDPLKREQMKPESQWEVQGGINLTGQEVSKAAAARSDLFRALLEMFERYDFLLLPSAQVFPFDADVHWPKAINGKKMDTYHRWMEVVVLGTMSGCPVINVPVGFNHENLPMGMQIIGKHHADFAVLQLAYAYEATAPWIKNNRPPILGQ